MCFLLGLFVVIKTFVGYEGLRIYFESGNDRPETKVPYECQTAKMPEDYMNSFCHSCRTMCREDPQLRIDLICF